MNLLINLHGLNTVYNSKGDILWENSNDNRAVTTSQDVSFGGGTYGGWSAFYSLLQTHLTYYPDAKIFPAHSTSGRDINWVNGVYSP